MNTNLDNNLLVFGKEYDLNWLTLKKTGELLEEAYIKVNNTSEIKIDYILEVLDKVSKAWLNQDYQLRKEATRVIFNNTSFSLEMINYGFEYISDLCFKNNIKKRINIELGNIEFLENGVINDNLNYILKARPKGVILHLNSDNLFFEIIESLISGIITKNVNILYVPQKYYSFIYLFFQSIKEFDKDNLIYPNQAIIYWNNNNIEEIIYNGVDRIIFNGKKECLANLKSKLNNDVNIIENVYGYSFAVIDGKQIKPNSSFQLFNNLALDICCWNQKSAFSPHVIYVIDKDLKSSHLLIESLFDEMIQVCDNLPIGNLSFNEKVEIRKVRELAKISQIKGEGRLVCPDDFSFTLILEYNSNFKISCLNRTVYIKRVLNLDSLFEHLLPFSGYYFSAGICINEELKQNIERDFINLGIKRITNIGDMNKKHIGIPQNGYFLLRELVGWFTTN